MAWYELKIKMCGLVIININYFFFGFFEFPHFLISVMFKFIGKRPFCFSRCLPCSGILGSTEKP